MKEMLLDIKCLDDSSQRELNAYRNIGSIHALRQLKRKDARRDRTKRAILKVVDLILKGLVIYASTAVYIHWFRLLIHS